jgi:hypothetical protein
MAKVNIGQGKTGLQNLDFFLQGTSASKKGNDGTGLGGSHSFQGLKKTSKFNSHMVLSMGCYKFRSMWAFHNRAPSMVHENPLPPFPVWKGSTEIVHGDWPCCNILRAHCDLPVF